MADDLNAALSLGVRTRRPTNPQINLPPNLLASQQQQQQQRSNTPPPSVNKIPLNNDPRENYFQSVNARSNINSNSNMPVRRPTAPGVGPSQEWTAVKDQPGPMQRGGGGPGIGQSAPMGRTPSQNPGYRGGGAGAASSGSSGFVDRGDRDRYNNNMDIDRGDRGGGGGNYPARMESRKVINRDRVGQGQGGSGPGPAAGSGSGASGFGGYDARYRDQDQQQQQPYSREPPYQLQPGPSQQQSQSQQPPLQQSGSQQQQQPPSSSAPRNEEPRGRRPSGRGEGRQQHQRRKPQPQPLPLDDPDFLDCYREKERVPQQQQQQQQQPIDGGRKNSVKDVRTGRPEVQESPGYSHASMRPAYSRSGGNEGYGAGGSQQQQQQQYRFPPESPSGSSDHYDIEPSRSTYEQRSMSRSSSKSSMTSRTTGTPVSPLPQGSAPASIRRRPSNEMDYNYPRRPSVDSVGSAGGPVRQVTVINSPGIAGEYHGVGGDRRPSLDEMHRPGNGGNMNLPPFDRRPSLDSSALRPMPHIRRGDSAGQGQGPMGYPRSAEPIPESLPYYGGSAGGNGPGSAGAFERRPSLDVLDSAQERGDSLQRKGTGNKRGGDYGNNNKPGFGRGNRQSVTVWDYSDPGRVRYMYVDPRFEQVDSDDDEGDSFGDVVIDDRGLVQRQESLRHREQMGQPRQVSPGYGGGGGGQRPNMGNNSGGGGNMLNLPNPPAPRSTSIRNKVSQVGDGGDRGGGPRGPVGGLGAAGGGGTQLSNVFNSMLDQVDDLMGTFGDGRDGRDRGMRG
ncbi:hypothetical protein HDU76_000421 [Blyttiomyces sp. JEL0837]|nr:hypothetical protein HDU76_000421 [Blyttiomyces sp. JEL0837]